MGACWSKKDLKKTRSSRSPVKQKETATSILRREAEIVQVAIEEDLGWEVPATAILLKLPSQQRQTVIAANNVVARAIREEIGLPIITVTIGDFNKPRVKSGLKEVRVWDEEAQKYALALCYSNGECNSVLLRDFFRR